MVSAGITTVFLSQVSDWLTVYICWQDLALLESYKSSTKLPVTLDFIKKDIANFLAPDVPFAKCCKLCPSIFW